MPVSAGAQAGSSTSSRVNDSSTESFFLKLLNFFQNAEEHCKDESYAYLPINHLLVRLADACRHAARGAAVGAVPQFSFKNSKALRRRIPDFALLITFLQMVLQNGENAPAREALLLLIWEVKHFVYCPWNSQQQAPRDYVLMRAEQATEAHLSQLSEQALFAFHHFNVNRIPSILSQGNCFTLFVYERPQNWDALMVKYAEGLRAPAQASAGPSGRQGNPPDIDQVLPVREQAICQGNSQSSENTQDPNIPAADAGKASDSLPKSTDEPSTEPESMFELGDLPIPEARASGFMLSPGGMGLTDEFVDAIHIVLELNGDVTISPHDPIFGVRAPTQDVRVQDPLDNVKEAIENFKAQQKAKKAPEPVPEEDQGPSAVPSEFVDPDAARLHSPPPGKYWTLRGGHVDWKSTVELERLDNARREAEAAAQAAARPSKRRKLNRSGDAARTADAQEPASGLTASVDAYRPPAMGTRSRTKSTAARIVEPAVAGPSRLAHGPPPDGRNKGQEKKRKDSKKESRE